MTGFVLTKGAFGLAKGSGAAMTAVRLGTFSRYGHAAICESVHPSGGIVIIEPMPAGCRRRTARPGEFVWSDVPLTGEQQADIVAYAGAHIGTPYDWPAIAGFVRRWWAARLRPGRHRLRALLERDDPGAETLICSELVVRAWRRAGVDVCPGVPADAVSPGDLRQWLDDRTRRLRREAPG